MNLFEIAARKKFRFPSNKGDLTLEQLYDLPLTSTKSGFDLDTIARGVNVELRSVTEESFVQLRPDPRKTELEQKLELVKHVIAAKIADQEKAKASAERAEKRRKLLDALAAKDDQALAAASREDIMKQLAELDEAAA